MFVDINIYVCYYNVLGGSVKKVNFNSLKSNIVNLLCDTQAGDLYLMDDNRVFKLFDSDFLISMYDRGYDFAKKILGANDLVSVPEIVVPYSVVYDGDVFQGYTMPFFDGISIYELVDYNKKNLSLDGMTNFFVKLESIIRRADNIVFPDLLSDGNILVNRSDIGLIDFDGLQVNEYMSPALSSSLGNHKMYINNKYREKNGLYTKELDIKSLIYLYFDLIFDCGLWELDNVLLNSDEDDINVKLEEIFDHHNIDSSILFDKVSRLYDNSVSNIYLGDTIDFIASNYELDSDYYKSKGVRRLVKK